MLSRIDRYTTDADTGAVATKIYYVHCNTRGDVEYIYYNSGTLLAKYTYDSWGKLLSVKNASGNAITNPAHIGNLNPIRYRGYYYDVETGLYYLQSRYYDPVVGRFLNADDTSVLALSKSDILASNLFTYCGNNPENYNDLSGSVKVNVSVRIVKHYVYVYKYDQKNDPLDHLDISIDGTTFSYGTNGAGTLKKLKGKANGYVSILNTDSWIANSKSVMKVTGKARV